MLLQKIMDFSGTYGNYLLEADEFIQCYKKKYIDLIERIALYSVSLTSFSSIYLLYIFLQDK